jgi:hypothetical protein
MVPLSSRCRKLLDRARTSPGGLRFQELVRLAEEAIEGMEAG